MNPKGKVQTKIWPAVVLLIWLGLSACAGQPQLHEIDPDTGQSSLDFWLEKTLIPYLLQQFDQHPRFRGQPVLLVRMQGENVTPHIDDLTAQIRQKITDALLKRPGLDLAWRPAFQPWKHYQGILVSSKHQKLRCLDPHPCQRRTCTTSDLWYSQATVSLWPYRVRRS